MTRRTAPDSIFRAEWPIEDFNVSREELKRQAIHDTVITLQEAGLVPLARLEPVVKSERLRVILAVPVRERAIHA